MAKTKGSIKTGGREKGTPNKKSVLIQDIFTAINFDVPLRIADLMPHLSPEKQVDVLLDLMSYLYPRRKAIEHSGPNGEAIQIDHSSQKFSDLLKSPEALSALLKLESIQNEQSK